MSHVIPSLSDFQVNQKVSDFLIGSEWDICKLSIVLPWHVVLRIVSIHVKQNVEDTVVWSLSNDGVFSVKSVYDGQFRCTDNTAWKWAFLWKLKLPPRVSHFLWILLHGKLLTNHHRALKGLTLDVTCMRCKEGCEDIEHVFRKCSTSIDI